MIVVPDFPMLDTPCLLLDLDRLERNCAAMRARCDALGVALRPHLKTAKSVEVTKVATGSAPLAVTVSTLREAEYFARAGHRDILYAAGIVPAKFAQAARIMADTGCRLTLITDSSAVADAARRFTAEQGARLEFLIEIDSGEHRGGLLPDDPAVVALAHMIGDAPGLHLRGVMTHAGHSYGTDQLDQVRAIAAGERDAAVAAADAIRAAGMACEVVSVGSSPTLMNAVHLRGVTEARAGIYMVWDVSQASRNICREDEIALSVLASVIGHNREAGAIILDAGALALSKDLGAQKFRPQAGYGLLCEAATCAPLGDLAVAVVHQEHGTVPVRDPAWFDRLSVGSRVRVLPNHACLTAAAYDRYHLLRAGVLAGTWSRINGW